MGCSRHLLIGLSLRHGGVYETRADSVTVGAAAAIGAKQASNHWPWLGTVARRAPYLSSVLIIGVGLYVDFHGWIGLNA